MKLTDLSPVTRRQDGQAWIMVVPVISTRHIPQSERDWLQTLTEDDGCVVFQKRDKQWPGTLFLLDEDIIEDDAPEGHTLNALCRLLHERGFTYVRFDPDGMVLDDLPTFP